MLSDGTCVLVSLLPSPPQDHDYHHQCRARVSDWMDESIYQEGFVRILPQFFSPRPGSSGGGNITLVIWNINFPVSSPSSSTSRLALLLDQIEWLYYNGTLLSFFSPQESEPRTKHSERWQDRMIWLAAFWRIKSRRSGVLVLIHSGLIVTLIEREMSSLQGACG